MIEFTQDGPFAAKADPLFPDRVRIVGLGQTGVSVCDQLTLHGRPNQDVWVFDTDQQAIEGSIVTNRHLLGPTVVHGMGCSGDLDLAREVVVMEENRLADVAYGCDFLVLVLGLAGSTGVALAEHFIAKGHEVGAKVMIIGVQPFAFEGWTRREKTIKAIASLRQEADSVLVVSQDRLLEEPLASNNVRQKFHIMHQLLAQTAQALVQVVCKRGLIQLSFADIRALYGRYGGSEVLENCWVSHVEGEIHDATGDLIGKLLAGPLLSDESVWKHIDHAIVAVSGTRDLGLSDVQELVGALKDRLPVNIPIATSASLDDDHHEQVRLTVLLAMTAPIQINAPQQGAPAKTAPAATAAKARAGTKTTQIPPAAAPAKPKPSLAAKSIIAASQALISPAPPASQPKSAPAPAPVPVSEPVAVEAVAPKPAPITMAQAARRFAAKQEEMQFEGAPRGRFEKTHETIYRGENLDQPTFRRRGLAIQL